MRDSLLTSLAESLTSEAGDDLAPYQFDPVGYIRDKLGWEPWGGTEEQPGQLEVINAYVLALRQLHEKAAFEAGVKTAADLEYWQPGQIIKNRIRVPAGHGVGKTKLSSGLVNHFYDCFVPSIIYAFAPTGEQIHDLLFKEIKSDRRGKGLPGEIFDLELRRGDSHFVKGRATNDNGGNGTERVQGQHNKYLMFVLDEAEGLANFVWGAVDSMASGGICIVLMLANPKTRASKFHKQAERSTVATFRISCISHPNVVLGREAVPGAVQRQYVLDMIEAHCEPVDEHDEDSYTFTVPFDVGIKGEAYPAGTIYRPNAEFLFRVLGIAPANLSANTLIPTGRFEAACRRDASGDEPKKARVGVDVAGYGTDYGTVYIEHAGRVWRFIQLWKLDPIEYVEAIKKALLHLHKLGVRNLHIRVDAGGGFGSGVIAILKRDLELRQLFSEYKVFEVHFNGEAYDKKAYADLATEMYATTGERLKALRLDQPPEKLEIDLCERTYEWVIKSGISVKKLLEKKLFRKEHRHSPDDGDGLVLTAAPDHLFRDREASARRPGSYSEATF